MWNCTPRCIVVLAAAWASSLQGVRVHVDGRSEVAGVGAAKSAARRDRGCPRRYERATKPAGKPAPAPVLCFAAPPKVTGAADEMHVMRRHGLPSPSIRGAAVAKDVGQGVRSAPRMAREGASDPPGPRTIETVAAALRFRRDPLGESFAMIGRYGDLICSRLGPGASIRYFGLSTYGTCCMTTTRTTSKAS